MSDYRRDVLVHVLVYHGRTSIKGCHCGWEAPGRSHAEHVADVYEASVAQVGVLVGARACPECLAGKHANCTGETWDDHIDGYAPCPCHVSHP